MVPDDDHNDCQCQIVVHLQGSRSGGGGGPDGACRILNAMSHVIVARKIALSPF